MMRNGLKLDSTPIELPLDAQLSHTDLRRLEPLQRVLLQPLDYESVDGWRAAVNRALVEAMGGDAAMFQLVLPGHVPHYTDDLPVDVLSTYPDYMPDIDRDLGIFRRSLELGAGNRYLLWKHHLRWLYRSEYFNEMIVGLRAFDTLWATAPAGASNYPAMIHTYHDRWHEGSRFEARHVQMMHLVRPALEAGVRALVGTLATRASLAVLIDQQCDGTLVYALDGRLMHRNRAAGAFATTKSEECALIEAGRQWARALAHADRAGELVGGASRKVTTRRRAYRLHAVRIGAGVLAPQETVWVTVAADETPLPDGGALREGLKLTRRQAEVALLLAQRKSNDEIATELVISAHTARRHTEAVMGKLGVRDRRDVAARVRRAAANRRSHRP